MIFVDIETTGLNPGLNCIASIGAITEDGEHEYYKECYVSPNKFITADSLEINGFTMAQLKDRDKPPEMVLVHDFFKWCESFGEKILAGVNVAGFDVQFLKFVSDECGSKWPFSYRTVDVHAIGYALFGQSMSSDEMSDVLGIDKEKEPHNALRGARHARDLYEQLLARIRGH